MDDSIEGSEEGGEGEGRRRMKKDKGSVRKSSSEGRGEKETGLWTIRVWCLSALGSAAARMIGLDGDGLLWLAKLEVDIFPCIRCSKLHPSCTTGLGLFLGGGRPEMPGMPAISRV